MEKSVYVRDMFAAIAPRYDATNRLLTGGADEAWRRRAIRELALPAAGDVVDLCCGTGDLAFHLARTHPEVRVSAVDFCEPMLAGARERAHHDDPQGHVRFLEGDVLALPFPAERFDGAIMGFAMRNVTDIGDSLVEARRVLKPGARFVNLDVTHAPNRLFRFAFDLYFERFVPLVGGLVGGSKAAYRYLPNSLKNFPNADELARRFTAAGFRDVRYVRLGGGAIAVHVGTA